jgi:hypothetical protein
MAVEIRASEGDYALDYTITDKYGTVYWRDSYLPDHIESFGRGDELFVRRGDVGMKIAEERKSKEVDSGVHKHRVNWRRWPAWRWLVSWLHR